MTLKAVYGSPPADEERIEAESGELDSSLLEEKAGGLYRTEATRAGK